MSDSIDFFFDFGSPYSYFVSTRIDAVAQRHGRNVVWQPVLLWAVLKAQGLPPPFEHPLKESYLHRDTERCARFYGLPFRLPSRFPASSHLPARAFCWLQLNAPALAVPFAKRFFEAYFVDDIDISVAAAVAAVMMQVTGESEEVARSACSDIGAKTALQSSVALAVERGVWGVPFIVIDGEPFFGADRLPLIEHKLASGISAAVARGVSG
jgi:2-hydroxychromene-2-carboxylate isomerase